MILGGVGVPGRRLMHIARAPGNRRLLVAERILHAQKRLGLRMRADERHRATVHRADAAARADQPGADIEVVERIAQIRKLQRARQRVVFKLEFHASSPDVNLPAAASEVLRRPRFRRKAGARSKRLSPFHRKGTIFRATTALRLSGGSLTPDTSDRRRPTRRCRRAGTSASGTSGRRPPARRADRKPRRPPPPARADCR